MQFLQFYRVLKELTEVRFVIRSTIMLHTKHTSVNAFTHKATKDCILFLNIASKYKCTCILYYLCNLNKVKSFYYEFVFEEYLN